MASDDDTKNQTTTVSPQWTRASKLRQHQMWNVSLRANIVISCIGTRRRKLESSLTELHEETMYVPNSALKILQEIGQGMH